MSNQKPYFGEGVSYCMQCRYARGGDTAILPAAGRRSEFDAGGDTVLCMTQMNLSARAYHRTQSVKLARAIADLVGNDEIQSVHLAEALQYRPKLMLGYILILIRAKEKGDLRSLLEINSNFMEMS